MITKSLLSVNTIFVSHLILLGLVVVGILPRAVVPFWTIVLVTYVLWASLEDSTTFFVRSIPFFIAIPIAAGFDSLNMWRILSGLIFLKWFLQKYVALFYYDRRRIVKAFLKHSHILKNVRINTFKFIARNKITAILLGLFFISAFSIIPAQSNIFAIKRIIYFLNLSLIGVVIYNLIRKKQDFSQRLIKNITIPTIIVAVIGMVQLATTYFMDIFQFMDFWGGVVERNMFGNAWAETAIKANTWFAYFGDQLSLRMFSIFPDTHSFPIFLLLGLPAVMALALKKVFRGPPRVFQGPTLENPRSDLGSFGSLFHMRASWLVIFVSIIFLALILTGTRGIWAAGVASTLWAVFLIFRLRKTTTLSLTVLRRSYMEFGYISSYLAIFFLLFGVAYYIIASDQFMVEKDSTGLFARRARSVIDISETSNARRIEIWKDSFLSIIKHPLLGVGIGNFPVVVGEDLARAKAGSSAHNLYLHIAAEMGLPALILALWFFWLLLQKVYFNFLHTYDFTHLRTIYFASLLIFLPWVLIYSLTDVAIFDERAFLLFVTTIALIFSQYAKS